MKKNLILVIFVGLLLTLNQSLSAQEETIASKLFYAELCGPGVLMSINWDARFNPNSHLGFGYRIGAGFSNGEVNGELITSSSGDSYYTRITRNYYTIPVGLNYVFGKPNVASAFEVGAGATFLTRKVSIFNHEIKKPGHVIGFFTFMYRFTPVKGGFSLRLGFTPLIGTSGELSPMCSLSFGYAF